MYQEPTQREYEVLQELSLGSTAKEIAGQLYISEHTVEGHRRSLVLKLGARNTLHMVIKAVRLGLV